MDGNGHIITAGSRAGGLTDRKEANDVMHRENIAISWTHTHTPPTPSPPPPSSSFMVSDRS